MKFLDEARVNIQGGDGGGGCVSFRREKHIEFGGPGGGNGGRGGDVVAVCVPALNTLVDFRYRRHFKARKGRGARDATAPGRTAPGPSFASPPAPASSTFIG